MTEKKLVFTLLVFTAAAAAIFLGIRQVIAKRTVAQDGENIPTIIPELATTSYLGILPLYEEASIQSDLNSGHGVSYLIRTDTATLLLDIGNNPEQDEIAPFMQNMQALGIDWAEINRIVISHLHPDHVGGLTAWRKQTIDFGELPGGIGDRLVFVPAEVSMKGAIHATIPTLPAPDVATTGAMAYLEPWPLSLRKPIGYEQALVIHVAGQGLVLITGCGHPTLETLVTRAETLYDVPVMAVIGGLHYESATAEDVQPDIQTLQDKNPSLVALSPHDSSMEALEAFKTAFPGTYQMLQVGEAIQFTGD
ncbi:MAG TPA: MBL fold metallo-hydrolase [Anaerolineales bacterium]|nr:MBL fold metallo-hydrolase [Anaerolineales bacterium]